jgi:2,3-dihydroxy-p-cumate/2,3-dihydroxybenzoate 3,4-dioxygenase
MQRKKVMAFNVNDVRFRRLGYLGVNVSDLQKSREFYEHKVGLKVDVAPTGSHLFLRCSDRHHDLVLYQSNEPGLKRIAWQMENAAALTAVRTHFADIGVETSDVSKQERADLAISEAFRATEPTTGATFEFYVDMAAAPSAYVPTHTKITRLGHVVLTSPDRLATETFLMEHLNFRVSDRIDGTVTFMRAFPNPYHHTLGVGQGAAAGLNHINFMVTEMADIGKGNNRMKQGGVPIVYGIGKHPPSESVFLYFLDPDGHTVEYSFGMEEFPERDPRAPRNLPASLESIDYWGGVPDMRFAKAGTLERLRKLNES